VPYSKRTAAQRRALTEGVAMVIGYIMLVVLWVVIAIFGLAAIYLVIRSAGR